MESVQRERVSKRASVTPVHTCTPSLGGLVSGHAHAHAHARKHWPLTVPRRVPRPIQVGDIILEVNGKFLLYAAHHEVMLAIAECGDTVIMKLAVSHGARLRARSHRRTGTRMLVPCFGTAVWRAGVGEGSRRCYAPRCVRACHISHRREPKLPPRLAGHGCAPFPPCERRCAPCLP